MCAVRPTRRFLGRHDISARIRLRLGVVMTTHVPEAVLVLEDQALIALYVEEILREAGFESIITCSTCIDAKLWLRQHRPKLAVIETKVRDGACEEVADLLVREGIPFIVHSVERDGLGRMPQKCKWIDKPGDPSEFMKAIEGCATA
jgi:two-component SAPR family response regulator